ncbi:YqzE family protein [Cohnella pontilimi]|uniref:YqzE family protein n=1 Tax=Cohnella pontilimi TaxID=2564100 RepID=A0A4U0F9F8_9BACL|nr:YqzE family protein [Cohnella pontilimi]TJY41345.1 YqzE family protein [Cohnella pontilimi]
MSDGSEYIKYVTKRVVTYWETPKAPEQRRLVRQRREPWVTRWFGQLLPIGIRVWLSGRKSDSVRSEVMELTEGAPDYR